MVDLWTSQNIINMTNVHVITSYAPSGSAITVYLNGLSTLNSIYLGNHSLATTGNSIAHRQGLLVHFAGRASGNEVITQDIQVSNSTTEWGVGAFMLFTNRSRQNRVQLNNSTFKHSASMYGGGLCANFQDYS